VSGSGHEEHHEWPTRVTTVELSRFPWLLYNGVDEIKDAGMRQLSRDWLLPS
jgi:hypothetical protein